MNNGVKELERCLALEWELACHHLEQNHASRKEVRSRVRNSLCQLFRCHVPWCPDHHTWLGQPLLASQCGNIGLNESRLRLPSKPKVEQLDAVRGEENIRRFQVSVNHATTVQRFQGGQDAETDPRHLRQR